MAAAGVDATQYFSNWMRNLPEDVKARPLNTLAIPGTHDSFSYKLDKRSPLEPKMDTRIKKVSSYLGPLVKPTIKRWAKTQTWSVIQQLQCGIRYFDVRLSVLDGDFYFVHGLHGPKISTVMVEICNFLTEHKDEIVLIDFNHFYEMNESDHHKLVDLLQATFKDKLCPKKSLSDVSIQTLVRESQQVLVFYDDSVSLMHPVLWNGVDITSPWPDVTKYGKLIDILEENYQNGKHSDKFHVTQGILTPTSSSVVKHSQKSLKTKMAAKAAGPFVEWLKQKSCGRRKGLNITIMDFAEMAGYTSAVIELNQKPIVEG